MPQVIQSGASDVLPVICSSSSALECACTGAAACTTGSCTGAGVATGATCSCTTGAAIAGAVGWS